MLLRFGVNAAQVVGWVAILTLTAQTVQAQVAKPFKIEGHGIAPLGLPFPGQPARPHGIVGQATHLGRHSGEGTLQTISLVPHPDGTITGNFKSGEPFKFVAANGDILTCQYGAGSPAGTYLLTPLNATGLYVAKFVAEFVPIGSQSTGRFAGVSGSWTMIAVTDPIQLGLSGFIDPITYQWQGEGTLIFKKGR